MSRDIISAVPSQTYKVKTEWLKDGCVCLNVAAEKIFEKDIRVKVRAFFLRFIYIYIIPKTRADFVSIPRHPSTSRPSVKKSDNTHASTQFVSNLPLILSYSQTFN